MSVQHVNLLAWRPHARRRVVIMVVKRAALFATVCGLIMVLLSSALHQLLEYYQAAAQPLHAPADTDTVWRTALPELEEQQRTYQLETGRYERWIDYREGQLLLWSILATRTPALETLKQVRFGEGGWEISLGVSLAEAAEVARYWQQQEPSAVIEVLDRRAEDGGFTRIRLTPHDANNTAPSSRIPQS